jgi:hypothetical protein
MRAAAFQHAFPCLPSSLYVRHEFRMLRAAAFTRHQLVSRAACASPPPGGARPRQMSARRFSSRQRI